jgi:hypothetical protein
MFHRGGVGARERFGAMGETRPMRRCVIPACVIPAMVAAMVATAAAADTGAGSAAGAGAPPAAPAADGRQAALEPDGLPAVEEDPAGEAGPDGALPPSAPPSAPPPATREALCGLVEAAAAVHGLPVDFFTRLISRESAFRTDSVSPKGAQGIAQFMPGTAAERGLADPFDPAQAIPASAHLLADLKDAFGNLGLAAAAYNAGPTRVQAWLDGGGGLPLETRLYVMAITGRQPEDWIARAVPAPAEPPLPRAKPIDLPVRLVLAAADPGGPLSPRRLVGAPPSVAAVLMEAVRTPAAAPLRLAIGSVPAGAGTGAKPRGDAPATCLALAALLARAGDGAGLARASPASTGPTAPWGVQVAGHFSRSIALAGYARLKRAHPKLLGAPPMVLAVRAGPRGTRPMFHVRVPAQSRKEASSLCERLRGAGAACVVLKTK